MQFLLVQQLLVNSIIWPALVTSSSFVERSKANASSGIIGHQPFFMSMGWGGGGGGGCLGNLIRYWLYHTKNKTKT